MHLVVCPFKYIVVSAKYLMKLPNCCTFFICLPNCIFCPQVESAVSTLKSDISEKEDQIKKTEKKLEKDKGKQRRTNKHTKYTRRTHTPLLVLSSLFV